MDESDQESAAKQQELQTTKSVQSLDRMASITKDTPKSGRECWQEVLDIGGETVYSYLQTQYILWDGIAVALLVLALQAFCFSIFLQEAIKCGIWNADDCTLSGGILSHDDNGQLELNDDAATPAGIVVGLVIALIFLLPDFMKGMVFLRKGYIIIGLVHAMISIYAIVTSCMYCATTSASDVSLLTNIVVLVFLTDLDERMFEVHGYARNAFHGKYVTAM